MDFNACLLRKILDFLWKLLHLMDFNACLLHKLRWNPKKKMWFRVWGREGVGLEHLTHGPLQNGGLGESDRVKSNVMAWDPGLGTRAWDPGPGA